MIEITIPAVGVAMTEAVVLDWLKAPGDAVAADEAVVEIETDKATTALESPVAGRLGAQLVAAGDTAAVGAVLARVLEGDEVEADVAAGPPDAPAAADVGPRAPSVAADGERAPHRLSPRARRLAAQAAAAAPAPRAADAVPAHDRAGATAPSADRFRQLIATKTLEAWRTIPHFTVTRELDAELLLAVHAGARARYGREITITDLLLRALARALPDGEADVALAVATPRGVLNPVIPGVLAHDLPTLAALRSAAVGRARDGRLTPEDVRPATVTLSNLGTADVDAFTGIVTPGQQALLTLGTIRPRPVADGDRVVVRRTLHATLNADHRTFDGADAAAMLAVFAAALTRAPTLTEAGA